MVILVCVIIGYHTYSILLSLYYLACCWYHYMFVRLFQLFRMCWGAQSCTMLWCYQSNNWQYVSLWIWFSNQQYIYGSQMDNSSFDNLRFWWMRLLCQCMSAHANKVLTGCNNTINQELLMSWYPNNIMIIILNMYDTQ